MNIRGAENPSIEHTYIFRHYYEEQNSSPVSYFINISSHSNPTGSVQPKEKLIKLSAQRNEHDLRTLQDIERMRMRNIGYCCKNEHTAIAVRPNYTLKGIAGQRI